MLVKRLLSLTLAASFLAAVASPLFSAEDSVRASVDRVAAQASSTPQFFAPTKSGRRMQASPGSGGSGAGKILVPLLLTAVCIGSSILIVKQVQKNSNPTQPQP